MVKVSFILPCYNVAPYFGRCIESIEHQDIPQTEYEVICVDDCSKDNTVEVIKEYQKQYPNIRLICHTENKTAGGARNTGIDAAQGKYIWCVDPDDSIESHVLGQFLKKACDQELDVLFFNLSCVDENGTEKKMEIHQTRTEVYSGVDYTVTHCAPKYLYNVAAHTGCLFRRDFLDSKHIRYPEIRSSQDVAFVWHAVICAERVSALSTIGYNIYRRPNSTTGSKGKLKAKAIISIVILYVDEINRYRGISDNPIIDKNLLYDMQLTVNGDSRKVLQLTKKEQRLFYKEIATYQEIIDAEKSLMDNKTKVIMNNKLPYPIWQMMIWIYMLKAKFKK